MVRDLLEWKAMSRLRSPHLIASVTVVLALASSVSGAQTAAREDDPFQEEQRITAVDLTVEFLPTKRGFKLPPYLAPKDFDVTYDGEPRPVIDVDVVAAAQHPASGEPWTIVLYFDLTFANLPGVAWAATELAFAAERLTALGAVSVVFADPNPREVLAATRDAEQLGGVLAELALFPEAGEHELLTLRDEVLDEIAKDEPLLPPAELFPLALAEEERLVRRHQDALLTTLADVEAGARRALVLVGGGYDLRPEEFYAVHDPVAEIKGSRDLRRDVEELGRTLGAYGWTTLALLPPPPTPVPRGVRIGKWLLSKPNVEKDEIARDPFDPGKKEVVALFNFFNLKREDKREPEEAEAFLELGEQLVEQEELEEAEQAFRMAIYHYAEDPKTGDRQAEALIRLGEVLRQLGRRREARGAFQKAAALDPARTATEVGPIAELVSPKSPLEMLAASTTGAVVTSGQELSAALTGLGRRVRLSYQVPGRVDGTLHRVAVSCRRGKARLLAPAWARSATPASVAAARVRRMLGDEWIEGDLELDAALRPSPDGGWRIEAELPALAELRPEALRLTYGVGSPEGTTVLEHLWITPRADEVDGRWSFSVPVVAPAGEQGLAILVEHMESGQWGAVVRELPER